MGWINFLVGLWCPVRRRRLGAMTEEGQREGKSPLGRQAGLGIAGRALRGCGGSQLL